MKVLLVNPPNRFWSWPPLGLAYVAAVLLRHGIKVQIVDLTVQKQKKLVNAIKWKPDLVGLTCTSQTFQSALQVARLVKEHSENVKVVFGGAHPSSMPKETLLHGEVDVVVKGEGENAMLKFCSHKDFAGVVESEPMGINGIPWPSRNLLPMRKYDYPGSILTSRGCPERCCYCVHHVCGYEWRGRTASEVVREMFLLDSFYGVNEIHVVDDNFSQDLQRAKTILQQVGSSWFKASLSFYNGVRADKVDNELFSLMKTAKTTVVSFGLESIHNDVLRGMGKNLKFSQIENAIIQAHEAGLQVRVSVIIGGIGDTYKKTLETIHWVYKNPCIDQAEFCMCTVYPGTPLNVWVQKHGRFLSDFEDQPTYFMDQTSTPSFDTPEFPAEQRVQALRTAQKLMQKKVKPRKHQLRNFKIHKIPMYIRNLILKR